MRLRAMTGCVETIWCIVPGMIGLSTLPWVYARMAIFDMLMFKAGPTAENLCQGNQHR